MYGILLLAAIPATLAAQYDSPGLGLIALAGALWAIAASICSKAPVIAGGATSINERLSTGLSIVAAVLAFAGLAVVVGAALT